MQCLSARTDSIQTMLGMEGCLQRQDLAAGFSVGLAISSSSSWECGVGSCKESRDLVGNRADVGYFCGVIYKQ
jgi:hypothetical protein